MTEKGVEIIIRLDLKDLRLVKRSVVSALPVPVTSFERARRKIDRVMLLVAGMAIITLVLDHGTYLGPRGRGAVRWVYYAIITVFVLENILKLILAENRKAFFLKNRVDFIVTASLLLGIPVVTRVSNIPSVHRFLISSGIPSVPVFYGTIVQFYIVYHIIRKGVEIQRAISYTRLSPIRFLIMTYLFVIILGTSLLFSPRATAPGRNTNLTNAFFTATSATCVTGLIVQETGKHFSAFGQGVILCLIQIGGLGLMTFTAFFSAMIGGMGLREKAAMREIYDYAILARLGRMIVFILLLTLGFELIGTALLFPVWTEGVTTLTQRIYYSVFHSVSAFCNAGFSLYGKSFQAYAGNITLNIVVPLLVIIGGLGFQVHANLIGRFRGWLRKERGAASGQAEKRLTLHTKIVLITTAGLLVFGMICLLSLEYSNTLKPLSFAGKIEASFFHAVTPRTAGFNTLPVSQMRGATRWVTMFLMFIGASPGSTGGGIKTSTFAIIILLVLAALKNRRSVQAFRRSVAAESLQRAVLITSVTLLLVFVSCLALTAVERLPLQQTLFEVISAQGTVGLTTGITSGLSTAGKLIICITMFLGRVGPLALVVALAGRRAPETYEFPHERILVG